MPEKKKEPMIGQESRPTAIDFDMPIANFKLRDLYAVIHSQIHVEKEHLKTEKEHFKEKEILKPEKEKELLKGEKEKEILKGEKEKEFHKPELSKPEKELAKPEKEVLKGEKELSKPEKPLDMNSLAEQVAVRVIEKLRGQGLLK